MLIGIAVLGIHVSQAANRIEAISSFAVLQADAVTRTRGRGYVGVDVQILHVHAPLTRKGLGALVDDLDRAIAHACRDDQRLLGFGWLGLPIRDGNVVAAVRP